MSANETFENNLDELITLLRVHNITEDAENNTSNYGDLLSTITDRIANLNVPKVVVLSHSKHIKLLIKALSLSEPLIRLIPVVGGALAGGVKPLVTYLSPIEPDIKDIIPVEIRDLFHNEKIDTANGIIKGLNFSLTQIQTLMNGQGKGPCFVHNFIVQAVYSAETFLGELESKIRRESQWKDKDIVVSEAKRLILLIELYCYLNLVVLFHFIAFRMLLPDHSEQFEVAFMSQKTAFCRSIQFLAEDNPIVSFYYPSKCLAIKKSLKYFNKRVQSLEEIHGEDFGLTNHTGNKLAVDRFFPRLISDSSPLWNNLIWNNWRYCFIFKKESCDNIYTMVLKTRENTNSEFKYGLCFFKNDSIHIGILGGDVECRLTRVADGHYMISNKSTCKPYRMKGPFGSFFTPLPQEPIINDKVFFKFHKNGLWRSAMPPNMSMLTI